MKLFRNFCLIAFVFYLIPLTAQDNEEKFSYSYITDRKFFVPDDFIGYTFFPSEIEYTDGDKDEVKPGEIGFAISPQDLMITGGEFKGIYSIVSIDAARFGFLLKLMDARSPTDQGHLKVILDGKNNVDAFVFKKSRDKQEVIFYQERINGDLAEAEKKYFTDRNEVVLVEPDSLWGTRVNPFLRVSRKEQDRIERADSVYFEFVKEVVSKEKPPKPEVKEEAEEEEEVQEEELAKAEKPKKEKEESTPVDEEDEFIMTDEDDDDEDEDFIDEDDPLANMIRKKPKKKKEPKKEIVEEIIEEEEELIGEAELAAMEIEAQEEELRAAGEKGKKGKEKIEKAPKERYVYKIVLNFSHWEGEGEQAYRKEEKIVYPIKTWKKLTSSDPKDVNERFLFEYSAKPNSILVFLDDNSSISKIQVGSVTYLMRGY